MVKFNGRRSRDYDDEIKLRFYVWDDPFWTFPTPYP